MGDTSMTHVDDSSSDDEVRSEMAKVKAWWIPEKKSDMADVDEEKTSILLKFITKQKQYSVPLSPIAVKEDVGPDGLNELLSSILSKDGTLGEVPTFEFMVNGIIILTNVGTLLKELSLSFEAVTDVEYFERHPPPTPKDNLEHDDWVSAVMNSEKWLLTGCYDNTVQLWLSSYKEKAMGRRSHLLTIPAHKAPVKAVAWIDTESDLKSFVSCSIDQTALVWQWDDKTNAVECVWGCKGHTQSVECLDVNVEAKKFATGSWDTSIKLWDTINTSETFPHLDNLEGDEPDRKRRVKKQKYKTPLATFAGHSESVSGLSWISDSMLLSCSWDHSIRIWDLNEGAMVSQLTGNVAFFSISFSKLNGTAIAGCADKFIRLYDPRISADSGGKLVQNKFGNHAKWIPSLRWSTTNENMFVSGSYDHSIRIWDRRSNKAALYNIWGHHDKVLAVDWSVPSHIASGSADNTVQLFTTADKIGGEAQT